MTTRLLFVLLVFCCAIHIHSAAYQGRTRKGPFKLTTVERAVSIPAKTRAVLERATIIKDVEITILHRSYWSSYCYQGTGFDPNTGCFSGITPAPPSYQESNDWIARNQCSVGQDCEDCYGDASDACLRPMENPRIWVDSHQLRKLENNNHFARHTCNLSWKCGIHKTNFPTFVTRREDTWQAYTLHANGTEITLTDRDYWIMTDTVFKKTKPPQMEVEQIKLPCFINKPHTLEISCFDIEHGNFIDMSNGFACSGNSCYRMLDHIKFKTDISPVNLQPASIEDVHRLHRLHHQ